MTASRATPERGVYLDWNATTPPHPDVLAAMSEISREAWANPASVHGPGRRARAVVEDARAAVAALAGFDPRDLVFVSGGTEANNLALSGARAIVTSRLEHPSVVRVAEDAERRGVAVTWLSASEAGMADPEEIAVALRELPRGTLVALSAVNHETGVVQPLREVESAVSAAGAWLHVDAVQAAGRLAPDLWQCGTSLTLAAHKMRGPKGVGALLVRPGRPVVPLLRGGGQERGLRPGTLDPTLLAGFRAAAARALTGPERYARLETLRDRIERSLAHLGVVNGSSAPRAPHVTNLSVTRARGDELAAALDLDGIFVSSGSACSAGTSEPSPVVTAMAGVERARSALRVSLGEDSTPDDVDRLIEAVPRLLARLRGRGSSAG